MDAREAARAVREIGAAQTIPIHFEGWSHFKQGREAARREFEKAGIAERVRWLEQGEPTEVELQPRGPRWPSGRCGNFVAMSGEEIDQGYRWPARR